MLENININVYLKTEDECKHAHTLTIPEDYYVVTGYDEDGINYEIYHKGKKIHDAYAIVLRKPITTVESWKAELEDDV